ncbi:hypothetical protein ACBI99_44010 [Nonomuraea sp. ATR24]|uniref:hypothetical protein n=1 Tax=Nonomuraea sp. ATR24 TaxID=1676744 RepID=UPI0035C19607
MRKNVMQILDLLTSILQVASAAAGLYAAITLARRQLARRVEGEPAEPPVVTLPATTPPSTQPSSVPQRTPGVPVEASPSPPEADARS